MDPCLDSAECRIAAPAVDQLASEKFVACAPEGLDLFGEGFADAAIAVLELQHCPDVGRDLERIRRGLKGRGSLLVVNENHRFIPTDRGSMADDVDLRALLASEFELLSEGRMAPEIFTKDSLRTQLLGGV